MSRRSKPYFTLEQGRLFVTLYTVRSFVELKQLKSAYDTLHNDPLGTKSEIALKGEFHDEDEEEVSLHNFTVPISLGRKWLRIRFKLEEVWLKVALNNPDLQVIGRIQPAGYMEGSGEIKSKSLESTIAAMSRRPWVMIENQKIEDLLR